VKEKDLEDYLCYDWYLRYSLLDHFLHPDTKFENFTCARYGEQGDFVNQPYTVENIEKKKGGMRINLYRKGIVWVGEEKVDIHVGKELILKKNVLDINYTLKNLSNKELLHLWFGVEFNFAFFDIAEKGTLSGVDFWEKSSVGENYKVKLFFSPKVELWFFPIYTVSASESGFERTLQGLCVLPNIKLQIVKDLPLKLSIRLVLEKNS
jgi:alpha-amylase